MGERVPRGQGGAQLAEATERQQEGAHNAGCPQTGGGVQLVAGKGTGAGDRQEGEAGAQGDVPRAHPHTSPTATAPEGGGPAVGPVLILGVGRGCGQFAQGECDGAHRATAHEAVSLQPDEQLLRPVVVHHLEHRHAYIITFSR